MNIAISFAWITFDSFVFIDILPKYYIVGLAGNTLVRKRTFLFVLNCDCDETFNQSNTDLLFVGFWRVVGVLIITNIIPFCLIRNHRIIIIKQIFYINKHFLILDLLKNESIKNVDVLFTKKISKQYRTLWCLASRPHLIWLVSGICSGMLLVLASIRQ